MFQIYRMPKPKEFFLIGGDCSQGGDDSNEAHFLSQQNLDFPIVYRSKGVAANMTNAIFPFLEWICDKTGIMPVVAFERQNGGASEMERLNGLNRKHKYVVFRMPLFGSDKSDNKKETDKFGWDTNMATRPKLVSDWKQAIDSKIPIIYDENTISQHRTFIVNNTGKPEASSGNHDDGVIAPAISWQLYQICTPQVYIETEKSSIPDETTERLRGFY